ncbi:acylphosphatase [Streptomyces triticirhizae]|uniref:Acylphosphatase n=1 Tax=Streptomyces triticirhizae TaxID=2483353 RepID=A0A3M2LDM0_9ACTN|nr:acylphosphatase [Streptomyces triticirhizae]RMI34703.1 acylphosphatase [Streptomyces triticirhizae]
MSDPTPSSTPGTRARESAPPGDAPARLTAWVRGHVQGVGFRWYTRARALEIGELTGFAANLSDGRVQVVAEGARERCERLLAWLREGDTPGRVAGVTEIWDTPRGRYEGFEIR